MQRCKMLFQNIFPMTPRAFPGAHVSFSSTGLPSELAAWCIAELLHLPPGDVRSFDAGGCLD
ncbi:hypothetical protein GAY33_22690 [Azospirillum brasilense]|uniref:Uncharacterized protein n=1 Tax=Azospirillum argentinense TaxID=2970906 RepID=A0A2K1FYQ5_9PROT|nr:hypothetical protein FH063_001794 [Azospirillum argentinense]MBK3801985.1 hypothetical protein [Azospirillum argentinense]PNQ97690.1 hypothetical protein C1S70_16640 [Azospirillum argentinense]